MPAPLVMPPIDPIDAFVAEAIWEHGRDPSVDGVIGAIGYRRAIGARGWIDGAIGVEAAALDPGGGLSLVDATIGAGLRVDDRAVSRPATTSLGVYLDWRDEPADAKTFVQIEAGFEAWVGPGNDVPALRAGAAAGVRAAPRTWLVAELTTIAFILDRDPPPPGGDFIHALDLGASIDLPRGAIAVRLEVPLDDALRARDDFAVGLAWRLRP